MLIEMDVQSLAIMSRCPQFLKCSVPVCPLDFLQELRTKPLTGSRNAR